VPLETASYINGLQPSNPVSTDLLSQSDDHIRLLKSTLKQTFPNLTGPVTVTQSQINQASPVGLIALWYGSSASCPTGWAVCNGQTVAKTDGSGNITTPNLVDRVPVGAGGTIAAQGATAGSSTATATTGAAGSHTHTVTPAAHTHTVTIGGTALTEAQLPSHRHKNGVVDGQTNEIFIRGSVAASPTTSYDLQSNSGTGANEGYTESIGSGATHTHTATVSTDTPAAPTVSTAADHTHSVSAISTIQPVLGLHYVMRI
jgi:hypothetical protein